MTQTQEKLGSHEVLRVTSDGEFIWHPEADAMLEEGDFSHTPAMPHILKALRKQRTWVGLTEEETNLLWENTDDRDSWELIKRVEAKLKQKNEQQTQ